jgi:hypothetical protein
LYPTGLAQGKRAIVDAAAVSYRWGMDEILQNLEAALGPWFSDDRPEDVWYDIRAYDREIGRTLTEDQLREYLAKKPPAFAPKPHGR